MRPRNIARPARRRGALPRLHLRPGRIGPGSRPTRPSDRPPAPPRKPRITVSRRKLDVPSGDRAAVKGTVAARRLRRHRLAADPPRRALEAARSRHDRCMPGRYKLRERLRRTGSAQARVRVAGGPGVAEGTRRDRPAERLQRAYASMVRPRPVRQPARLRRAASAPARSASRTRRCRAGPRSRSSAATARSASRSSTAARSSAGASTTSRRRPPRSSASPGHGTILTTR